MRYLPIIALLVVLTGVAMTSAPVEARALPDWPYDRLMKEADLVVIAEATSVADAGETWKDNPWKIEFVGVVTRFKVKTSLKGKVKDDEVKVLHYRPPPKVLIEHGPGLVSFRLKGISWETKTAQGKTRKPEYLLFLKKDKDGRYEPVSGQVDPELSVREMYRPLPEELGGEKEGKRE